MIPGEARTVFLSRTVGQMMALLLLAGGCLVDSEGTDPQGRSAQSAARSGPPPIVVTGTVILGGNAAAFLVGPDGIERKYQLGACVPRHDEQPTQICRRGQAKLVGIDTGLVTVEMENQRYQYAMEQGRGLRADRVRGDDRYLTSRDVVESVCANFAGTGCARVGYLEVARERPVHHVIYPMCFEVFVQDWRENGGLCLRSATILLKHVAYGEFF